MPWPFPTAKSGILRFGTALRLVRRSGNGYNNVTELGRSISLADMIAIDRFYASQERRERYAKRQR